MARATMNTFALPSSAAPNTSSATSCAKSFTCVFHVSPKGTRVFGVGSELADDDGRDKHLPERSQLSTRVLGASPMGSVGAACVCWACLKIGRESVCLKRPTVIFVATDTQTDIHTGIGGYRKWPPLYAHMPLPVLRSYTPGRRPRTPG